MIFSDILSISTIFLYIIPVILYGITNQSYHKQAFIGILATLIITICVRHIFVKDLSLRPHGAINCDIMATNGNQAGQPGMASSHSAIAVFFALFYYRHITNPFLRTVLILYAISIMISRYDKKCHTISQIIFGGLLGVAMNFVV